MDYRAWRPPTLHALPSSSLPHRVYTPTKMVSPLEITLLVLLGLLWGMPYALTKIALTTIPPITLVGSRVALAAIVLWIIVLFTQRRVPAQWNFVGCLF